MKTRRFYIPLLCLILSTALFFSNCKKTPDDQPGKPQPKETPCDTCLPPITTTGKNTFGCRINGKVWMAKNGGGWIPTTTRDYYNYNLFVRGADGDKSEAIAINLYPLTDTGFYQFPNSVLTRTKAAYSHYYNNFSYVAEPIRNGYVHITYINWEFGVFAGTFEFELYSKTGDTIQITDGRFDLSM